MHRQLIAFCGPIGAGKTTAAAYLVEEFGYRRVRFAGPLKDMLRALGLSDSEIDGARKEQPCDLLGGKTPRYAMQALGTEWGRDLICSDLWIRAWYKAVSDIPEGVGIVADDLRFPNEARAISDFKHSKIIKVSRPGVLPSASHVSELQTFPINAEIINDGDKFRLYDKLDQLLRPKEVRFN